MNGEYITLETTEKIAHNDKISELYKKIEAQDKIINTQALEIARLNKQLEYLRSNEYLNQVKWERNFNEDLVKDLKEKIDKAIEYNQIILDSDYVYSQDEIAKKNLEILGDKE